MQETKNIEAILAKESKTFQHGRLINSEFIKKISKMKLSPKKSNYSLPLKDTIGRNHYDNTATAK